MFAVGAYAGRLRHAILAYKDRDQRWWAGVFARLLAGLLRACSPWFEEFDLLTAVPAFSGAGARRRWDPLRGILGELADLAGAEWQVSPDAVVKSAETAALRGRSGWERRRIAEGELRRALRVPDPSAVEGRRVLVADDVFTEGSTLQEVARRLLEAGALEVAGLVVARQPWHARGRSGRVSAGSPLRSLPSP